MTNFDKAVAALMSELDLNSAAGLITSKALELMGPVRQHLESIKRLEKKLAEDIRKSSLPPAQEGQRPSETK